RPCRSNFIQRQKNILRAFPSAAAGPALPSQLKFFVVRGAVQRGKVIGRGLGAADQLVGAVLFQQHLGAAQLAVVVIAHREPVGAGVVDDQNVALVDFGQHAVDGKLVVVLAQAAGDVVLVVAGGVLFTQ